jgi:hypothetical protein
MARRKHNIDDDWLIKISAALAYLIGVGGPVVIIILGIMGKLPS